jgi:hypothetical protein
LTTSRQAAGTEVIDPGNFSFDDEAIVLLDDLSAADHVFSLNQYEIAPGHTKAELVGKGIGSIAVHEAGHRFGNFHTELYSDRPDLMDGAPYSLDLTVGVGPDRIFGSGEDIDVDFGVDVYNNWGVFVGSQDTLNTIAFGLATGRGIRAGATAGSGIPGRPVDRRNVQTGQTEPRLHLGSVMAGTQHPPPERPDSFPLQTAEEGPWRQPPLLSRCGQWRQTQLRPADYLSM